MSPEPVLSSSIKYRRIPHDRLFRDLLQAFFVDFLAGFAPKWVPFVAGASVTFLDRETLSTLRDLDRREPDLVAEVRRPGQSPAFLIHIELQARRDPRFAQRMMQYGVRLHEKFRGLSVWPLAVFVRRAARRNEPDAYVMHSPSSTETLRYQFELVDLSRMAWREALHRPNLATAALMAVMRIPDKERARVKWECHRMAATLCSDLSDVTRIGRFVEPYLTLNEEEQAEYDHLREGAAVADREAVTEVLTYWERKGLEQGREQGLIQGDRKGRLSQLLRLVERRFGSIPAAQQAALGELDAEHLDAAAIALIDAVDESDWHTRLAAILAGEGCNAQSPA